MRDFGLGRFIGQIPHFKNDYAGCSKRHRGEEQELCNSDSGCGFTRREFRWQISCATSGAICHQAQLTAGALRDRQTVVYQPLVHNHTGWYYKWRNQTRAISCNLRAGWMLLALATEPSPMQWSTALCTPGTAIVLPFPDLQLLCTAAQPR